MHDKMIEMLQAGIDSGRGVTLYLAGGQEISIVVTEVLGADAVVGKNQEYGTIVVDLANVHACAAY
jgi:hypothetical protein